MVRIVYIVTLMAVFAACAQAQNFPVGHRTITYTDATRGNRPVPSELYYPASVAGENTPLATGLFPVITFGHGFQMGYDSYFYFKDAIVPAGYILVFAKTETSLSPNHAEFGQDLAFLVVQIQAEGLDPISPFFQHVGNTSAVMGHSMGGGASFLGCKNNALPTAMVTWAAAETTPSAIAAATHIATPSLVFSADKDCVTPPTTNQVPMYDSLASACKVFINIKGGGHCYFADASFICSLGEIGCPPFTITRDQQHAATLDFTKLFLDFYLKNQPGAWTVFNDSLTNSPRITFQKSCTTTFVSPVVHQTQIRVFPNPAEDITYLSGNISGQEHIMVCISDVSGRKIQSRCLAPAENTFRMMVDMRTWTSGVYFAEIRSELEIQVIKIVKY